MGSFTSIVTIGDVKHVSIDGGKSFDPPLPKSYEKRRKARFAEMLASHAPPRCMTDDVLIADLSRHNRLDNLNEHERAVVLAGAKKHGYTPKPTDTYIDTLAKFPGDPDAFLNHGQGQGHLKKLAEKHGQRGHYNIDRPEPIEEPKKKHRLHPRIVNRNLKRKLAANPDLAAKVKEGTADINQLKSEIIEKHGSK